MDEAYIKRILPNSEEAERSVIGSMIVDREAIVVASDLLEAGDFYNYRYGVLFGAIMELFNENIPVDFVTLQNRLKEQNVPPEICSYEFLGDITSSVPTSANVRHHAEIVGQKATLRRLIKTTEDIAGRCYLDKENIESILEDSEKQIFDIVQNRRVREFEDIREIVLRSLDNIEAASRNKGSITGVATGFYDLDYKTAGLQPSDLVLIAARPSMGKTALALNIAEHAMLRLNITTVFFSLEMSRTQLVNRLLSMNSRVDAQAIRTGDLKDNDWSELMESARKIGGSKLIIDDSPGITINELRSKCRKLKLEKNLGLIIIDYLQLMQGSRHVESRQQEISEISRSLKSIARETNCPVIALSQLSRAVEQRPDKRPMLSDLRESGAIEQDADVVMFIYRDEYYNRDSEDKGVAEIIIGKQRNGPTGTVKLGCQLQYTRFTNLQKEVKSNDS